MQLALYPKPMTDDCPYCGSKNVRNQMEDCRPTASGCSVECVCGDCGRSYHLNYKVESVTLENGEGELVDFYVGQEIPDMGADDEEKARKAIVAAVIASDGLCVMAANYGDGGSPRGYGCPVILEQYDGELRVVVWDDVNSDDYGQLIPLGGASFEKEDRENSPRYGVRLMTPDGTLIEEHLFEDPTDSARQFASKMTVPGNHYVLIVDGTTRMVEWDSRSKN